MKSALKIHFCIHLFLIYNIVRSQEYIGCYKDNATSRMFGYVKKFLNMLTPQVCFNHCQNLRYSYYGLQYRWECFCGENAPDSKLKVDETECKLECSGDNKEICGGDRTNSVYKIQLPKKDIEYLGCYQSQVDTVSLVYKEFGSDFIPSLCIDYCREKKYNYAGLQLGYRCYCDNNIYANNKIAVSNCNFECPGDGNKICGGLFESLLYDTRFIENPDDYMGCYKINETSRVYILANKDFQGTLTYQLCLEYCQNLRFSYAGLQKNNKCFCGKSAPDSILKVNEDDCKYPCTYEKKEMCVEDFRMSVYLVKYPKKVIDERYLGCYKDNITNRMYRHVKLFPFNLTYQVCLDHCQKIGYAYSALQENLECYCGENVPDTRLKANEGDCNHPCTGNKNQMCGGDSRSSVYMVKNPKRGQQYLGCYNDDQSNGFSKLFKDSDTMTIFECFEFCKEQRSLYAALRDGYRCFCANYSASDNRKISGSLCNSQCRGDPQRTCGGNLKIALYYQKYISSSLGCFYDYPPEFAEVEENLENMTPFLCVDICIKKGFQYAGLRNGVTCKCGRQAPKPDQEMDPRNCYIQCKGNLAYYCGGYWENNYYDTGLAQSREVMPKEYMGCYMDNKTVPLYKHLKHFYGTLTYQGCLDYCQNLGFNYAALQYYFECRCGYDAPNTTLLTYEEECSNPCSGDKEQKCGGDLVNSVYKVKNPFSGMVYLGCYIDQQNPREFSDFNKSSENITPFTCLNICREKRYRYAAVQSRNQCFCGNQTMSINKKVADSECNSKCGREEYKTCGGYLRNAVFTAGPFYKGCYEDQITREIQDYREDSKTLTPESCIMLCTKKGFKYAGVQNGYACFCGTQLRSNRSSVPDEQCNVKCTGDSTKFCGGPWRNSVYDTGV